MIKISFLAKTNLNTDGRILNQLQIINNSLDDIRIDFILLEDKPTKIDLGKKVVLHPIKTLIRNNNTLRFFTVLEFTCKSFFKLLHVKPQVIHAQDIAVVLPVLLYRLLKGNKVKVIYDDHELPNQDLSLQQKIFVFLEKKLLKKADKVIFANEERLLYLLNKYNLRKSKLSYFINLPYFEVPYKLSNEEKKLTVELEAEKRNGIKLILHQGSIKKQRGRDLLAQFSKNIDEGTKIMLLGINKETYQAFIDEYKLDPSKFYLVGYINYHSLNQFWSFADATIIMYLPEMINNRLCAPNRFYIALKHNIPIYVNKDNPVLHKLITKYKCGYFIEDIISNKQSINFNNLESEKNDFKFLINKEVEKLIKIYECLISSKNKS